MFDIDAALRYLIAVEGSDLHLKVPSVPLARVHGRLVAVQGGERLVPADTEHVLLHMLTDETRRAEFEAENEVDFSYSIEGLARFRVNAFRQRGSISIVCRAIPFGIKTIEDLNLPPVIRSWPRRSAGSSWSRAPRARASRRRSRR